MKVVAKPISMITHHLEDGSINPIRFKMEDKVIKIDKIIKQEREKLAGNIMEKFLCSSTINGTEKIYEIKFDTKTYKWILFKI